jgi:hypothetical protein
MGHSDFAQEAQLVSQVALEIVDEPDVVCRRPEVVEAVAGLAGRSGLNDLFGGNGHDPDAFVTALAAGLRPYTDLPITEPELVEGISLLAVALQGQLNVNGSPHHVG